jgi:signal transduction histidine kinase
VADNASRQLKAREIRDVINGFITTVAPSLVRAGIEMSAVSYVGYRLFPVPMHSSEWASILFNFLTNARKAIRRKGVAGRLHLRAGRSGDSIFVEFADNGDGIPADNAERVFNAFFTTSAPVSRDSADHDDILGTGLGLKIVRDIVTSYGGSVNIVDAPTGYSTCFRISIPEAQPSEVPDGDY